MGLLGDLIMESMIGKEKSESLTLRCEPFVKSMRVTTFNPSRS